MIRRPPRSTQSRSSAASDVYKRQGAGGRRLLRRAGRRRSDLRPALASVPGDIDGGCQAAGRSRAAASGGGAAEKGPAAVVSDALAALRAVVEDAAEVAIRSVRPLDTHL